MKRINHSRLAQGVGIALATLACQTAAECRAETAYVVQIPVNVTTTLTFNSGTPPLQTEQYRNTSNHVAGVIPGLPETGGTRHGNNLAQTLEIGMRNSVYHLQSGAGNISTAGIIGNYGKINVLQAGNNLRSNVVLLNGAGMNVSVLQPAGSAPINVLIARLPGGGLLIKR
ncbi:hypothetical protein [Rhizobium lusitanum]|uniref:Uncharacterized protein n=1 Tax=Rhizobium lusitanum TaxID=293958 RepID=A0A7X0MEP9_9HYPH|nr:hypothetical protein [Rhizobium lusitanum]MBB6486265.1 hypothetical protein [Rhizobium lusitanum]